MREVFEDHEEARARAAQRGAADIRRSHSAEASGRAMPERLERIRGTLPTDDFDPTGLARQEAAAAQELVQAGQTPAAATSRIRRAPRAAVLRAMKPHTRYAQQVDRGVTDALMHLGHAVESLEGRVDALVTRQRDSAALVLRELRGIDRRFGALESDRLHELARQVDELRAAVAAHERVLIGAELTDPDDEGVAPDGSEGEPWSEAYNEAHRDFVARELDDAELLARFRDGPALPDGFGHGLRRARGRVPVARRAAARRPRARRRLDAQPPARARAPAPAHGRAAHRHARARGARRSPSLGVSYLYADLRELPLATPPTTACCRSRRSSTSAPTRATTAARRRSPRTRSASCWPRVAELRRVLRPGGDCYITVPVGAGERFDWVRSLTPEQLDEIVDGVRARDLIDRLLPLRRRRVAAVRPRRRRRRALPRPLHERARRAGRRRGGRGGRLPAPREAGLMAGPRASIVVVSTANAS